MFDKTAPKNQQPEYIRQIVADAGDAGVGMAALEAALQAQGLALPRRTILRRLDALIALGAVQASGNSRAVVYRTVYSQVLSPWPTARRQIDVPSNGQPNEVRAPAPDTLRTPPLSAASDSTPMQVPLSAQGLEIRDRIRQPLPTRPSVGYQRAWSDAYHPNDTAYLSPEHRARLWELGRTALPVHDAQYALTNPQQHPPAGALPAGTYARQIFDRLLVDLSWASSRLEGNTYTQLDTQNLIEFGQAAQGKDATETQMVLNHKAAIEMLVDNAADASANIGFNRFTILNLHAILSDNLITDPLASGRLRTREVRISGTSYIPLAVPQQLQDNFDVVLAKAAQIQDPFEQAFFAMVHLPYLQAFEDVNKRVSRLAANIPLLQHNLCPLSFVDVPQAAYAEGLIGVYELQRTELLRDVFVWAYTRSCQRYLHIRQTLAEPDAFRLQYRDAIQQTVQGVVRSDLRGTPAEIAQMATGLVSQSAMQSLVEAVTVDLAHLYEGNVARYRLKLSELLKWKYRKISAQGG
jgi:Fic family protein